MTSSASFDDDSRDRHSTAVTRTAASRAVVKGKLSSPSRPAGDGFGAEDPGSGPRESPRYVRSEPLGPGPSAGRFSGPVPFSTVRPSDQTTIRLKNPLFAGALGFMFGPLGAFIAELFPTKFGPLGLAYANPPWAVGLGVLSAGAFFSGMWILLPGIWFASGFIGFGSAIGHNTHQMLGSRRPTPSLV